MEDKVKYPQFPIGGNFRRDYGIDNVYNGIFEVRGYVDDCIIVRWQSYRYEMIHKKVMFDDLKDGCIEVYPSKPNRYTKKLDSKLGKVIFTVGQWEDSVDDGFFYDGDGSGYWVKDGFESCDEVFSTPKLDATHVVWYNK